MTGKLSAPADLFAATTSVERWLSGEAKDAWSQLDPRNLQRSFVSKVLPGILPKLVGSQRLAASFGAVSTQQQVARQLGHPVPASTAGSGSIGAQALAAGNNPNGRPLPVPQSGASASRTPTAIATSFAGVSSSGGSLTGLLSQPLIQVYSDIGGGMDPDEAMGSGFGSMDRMLTTQVHDASRESAQVQMIADPEVLGYVRITEPDACGRCIILAGRVYHCDASFERHPQCRCSGEPNTAETPSGLSIGDLFDAMSSSAQDRSFTVAGAQAIRDGADPARVINARAGMSTTATQVRNAPNRAQLLQANPGIRNVAAPQNVFGRQLLTTHAGPPRIGGGPRLMPSSIYLIADGDRAMAVDLLQRHGFLTGTPVLHPAPSLHSVLAPFQTTAAQNTATRIASREAGAVADAVRAQDAADAAESAKAAAKAGAKAARQAATAALRAQSDDEVAEQLVTAYSADDDATVSRLEAELDRRDAAKDAAAANAVKAQDRRDAAKEAQSVQIQHLIEGGEDPYEATESVTGVSVEQQHRAEVLADLRSNGYEGRSFDDVVAKRYKDLVAEQMVAAERYTLGGDMRNAAGIKAHVDDKSLFFGNESIADKYASPELRQFWDDNGRLTLASLKHQLLTGLAGPAATQDFLR